MKLEYIENGSYDTPLIRLYDFDPSAATELRRLILQLAAGSSHPVFLHTCDGVEPVRDCRLICKVGAQDEGIRQEDGEFTWVLVPETWAKVADLIEPFCEHLESSSFQYLDQMGDVTLILSVDGGW